MVGGNLLKIDFFLVYLLYFFFFLLTNFFQKNRSTIKEVLTGKVETLDTPIEDSPKSTRSTNTDLSVDSKSVQTDIQNINSELVVSNLNFGLRCIKLTMNNNDLFYKTMSVMQL